MKDFAIILKQERNIAGLSLVQASKILEVPYRTLQDWERSVSAPPEYVQKALLYCLNAIRADLLAGEIRADVVGKFIEPTDYIHITRDELGRIIDWSPEKRSVRFAYEGEDWQEMGDNSERILTGDALAELERRDMYLSEDDIKLLYPDD